MNLKHIDMNQLSNKEDLTNLVRNYVHYDNLTATFQKQLASARTVRNDFEQRIIQELKNSKMENAIIQIVGGKLKIVEEKHTTPLTYKTLEDSLHKYFNEHKLKDSTSELIKYVKSQRTVESSLKIQKIHQLPPQPNA
jgi:hypothetical protein